MKQEICQFIGKVKLGAKRNAPELLLGGSLITGTATVIMSSRATLRANDIKTKLNEDLAVLEYGLNDETISGEDAKKQVKGLYIKYAASLAKEYAIPVGLYTATVGMIFASYKIQKSRQLALSAAFASCTAAYTTLVNKIKTGAAIGLTAEEVLNGVEGREVINPETGEVTMEKVQGLRVDASAYQVRFDEYSTCWEKDKFQNEATLRGEENWANDRLRLQGYVFLNDIYDRLGLPKTQTGQVVGWLLNGEGDGFIDFGIMDCSTYEDVRYDDNAFDLNFNVDGDILTNFMK